MIPYLMIRLGCKKIIQSALIFLYCALMQTVSAFPDVEGIQVYEKNIHLFPEGKQNLAEDINRYHNAENLWEVLRQEFVLPHYEDDPLVQAQINFFMSHQAFLLNSANRAAPYLYFILQQARKKHLPAELVLLPIIESAYNPFAYSPAGAAGIWQMMPNTASGYGIKQDWWFDGRRDVIASTKGALTHLSYLGNFFNGNWLLALAAYDTGEGHVLTAINKNIREGKSTDFWYLPLAQETRDYVPRLLALATIIAHPYKYPVYFPPVRNAPYLAQIDIGAQIDLNHAAYLAGLSLKQLMQLNPGYNRAITDPDGPYKMILPIENVVQFTENLDQLPLYRRLMWKRYRIRAGDTLTSVAKLFHITPTVLCHANHLRLSSNYLRPGRALVIPHTFPAISKTILDAEKEQHYLASNVDETRAFSKPTVTTHHSALATALENIHGRYQLQPGDTIYMAREGDTMQRIAHRFHTSTRALEISNQFANSKRVMPGEKLIIPTHIQESSANTTHDAQKYELLPGDTIYLARHGDTMEKIAKKFHVTEPRIRGANMLADNTVQDGDRLVIPTHLG